MHDRRGHRRPPRRPQPRTPGQARLDRHRPHGRLFLERERRLCHRFLDRRLGPRPQPRGLADAVTLLRDDAISLLFQAAAEASEEAIWNSLFKAVRTEGKDGHVAEALPLDRVKEALR
jgi:hypothetical protein